MRVIRIWGLETGEINILEAGRSVDEFPRPKINKFFKVIVSGDNAVNIEHPEFPAEFKLEEAIRCIDCPYYGVWSEPPHKRIVLLEEKDLIKLHGEGWKNFVYGI